MLTGDFRKSRTFTSQVSLRSLPPMGEQDEARMKARKGLESVGFDVQETEQYVDYLGSFIGLAGKLKGGFRWIFLAMVGIGAGSVAVIIQFLLRNVNEWKFQTQEWLYENDQKLFVRYMVWISTCIVLAAMAGVCVCYIEPLAGGSGIPEIKCVLNGIELPNVLRLKTLGAKAFGIVCSVAAGLPCGKEGPMIHSGAIVAAQATRLNAGPLVTPFRTSVESRDFIVSGAAAGVAAAFGAPIGGVLFAVEEGASHMNPRILVRAFYCAAFSALTVRFFAGPMEGTTGWGTLGTDVPVEFGRFTSRRYKIWEMPIFALIGIGGGLLGALFNGVNTRLSKWRMRNVGSRGHWRFAEVLVVTVCIVSFNFLAPVLLGGDRMEHFGPSQRLFVDLGGEAIRDLLHSTEHYDVKPLLFFAIMHYLQTIWTYGLGVPSGLFVPSLLGGAAFGRIIGQTMGSFEPTATSAGLYALIGATAMLAGMARITISLVVILMETTGEAEWGVPIFLVVMMAKWTGDLFNKGIYDIHIELRHIPVLEQRPEKLTLSWTAKDIMARSVVSLPPALLVKDLLALLSDSRHSAFPVVDSQRRFVGLVERTTVLHVLQLGSRFGAFTAEDPAVGDADADAARGDATTDNGSVNMVPYEAMVRNRHPLPPPLQKVVDGLSPECLARFVDLRPYTNMGCYTVQGHAAALRCHMLFRTMGLRHLPVLAKDHTVCGMITRKDILNAVEQAEELRSTLTEKAKEGAGEKGPCKRAGARQDTSGSCESEDETSEDAAKRSCGGKRAAAPDPSIFTIV